MKVCFNARPNYDDISVGLFKALQKNGVDIDSIFVCVDGFETAKIKSLLPTADVRQMNLYIREEWKNGSDERLRHYEAAYDCAPIWQYIYTDRFLVHASYDYVVKTVCGLFAFYEDIFKGRDIDYYYDEAIATMQSYVAFLVSRKLGARYVSQMLARGLDGTHHYTTSDPFQLISTFDRSYKQKVYSREIRARAERFLREYEEQDAKPEYMRAAGRAPRLSINLLKLPFIYMKKRFYKKYNDPFAYLYYKQYNAVLQPILFYFRYLKSRKFFNKPADGQKYVLFPLHFQPEASTCVCAQKYENQLFFIDSLAKSLPSGTFLYVKEHYAFIGHRKTCFYKELSRYPNVVLISPWANTRSLIVSSEAVATLTGTAGWEAMLLRKPVIVGGNVFYQNAPGVYRVDDVFAKYKSIIMSYRRPSRNEIIMYLCEYFSTIRKGTLIHTAKAYSEADNFNRIADSFIRQDKMRRLGRRYNGGQSE